MVAARKDAKRERRVVLLFLGKEERRRKRSCGDPKQRKIEWSKRERVRKLSCYVTYNTT